MSQETPENANGGGNQPGGEKGTFTQSDIDRIVAERLAREREKFSGYDELKEKAEKWAEFEQSQKSELQKANEAREKAEREAQEAMRRANERLIQAEFIAIASGYGVAHPEDAYRLSSRVGVEIGEDGRIAGVDAAVKELLDAGRLPLTGKPKPTSLDSGAGGHERTEEQEAALTAEEKELAAKMRLTEKEYRDAKKRK